MKSLKTYLEKIDNQNRNEEWKPLKRGDETVLWGLAFIASSVTKPLGYNHIYIYIYSDVDGELAVGNLFCPELYRVGHRAKLKHN
jgi:hypothetical protein